MAPSFFFFQRKVAKSHVRAFSLLALNFEHLTRVNICFFVCFMDTGEKVAAKGKQQKPRQKKKMVRTLVADLPPMTASDLARFEAEGGVWGQQRAIRRQQLGVAAKVTALCTVAGLAYVKVVRRNTWYVVLGTVPMFALFGFASGHALGVTAFPSVANNKETTMMRRTWWAKECSKDWDYSQVEKGYWHAQYPKVAVPK